MVCLDKLDYCASTHNLDTIKGRCVSGPFCHEARFLGESYSRASNYWEEIRAAPVFEHPPPLVVYTVAPVWSSCPAPRHAPVFLSRRPNFKFIRGDILSADLVRHVLSSEGVDTVMHFAAQTHVDNSFGNSLTFTINNTLGTHMLLEACR